MRSKIAGLILVISISSNAALTVKSVACSSGTLNADRTITIGYVFTDAMLAQIKALPSSRLDVENETVLALEVSGNNDGACANNDKKTILILNLVR